jgi:hypothetical protein
MARNVYRGSKRRRELDKKKKRAEKLARKQNKPDSPAPENDTSYLEYLHPGGVPEELLPDSPDDETDESGEDSDDE